MPPAAAPSPAPSRRLSLALGLLAAAVPVGLHVDWILRDARLPRDLGLFYQRVPETWRLLTGGGGDPGEVLRQLGERSGGWYEALLAGWMALVGRSPAAFQAVDLAWMLALLALVAASTAAVAAPASTAAVAVPASTAALAAPDDRRGPQATWAAALATLLAAAMPFLVIFPRLSWIHVAEAALVLGAALPWLRDPTLPRGAAWTALLGALAVQLRPSALPWLAPLGIALAWGVAGRRPPLRRLLGIGAAWLLASLPALVALGRYLGPKLAARERYARDVPPFLEQLVLGAGPLVPFAAAIGLALALRRDRRAPELLLLAWTLLSVALWAGFRAGMDNFLVGFAALAILGGAGLARLPRAGLPLALAPWLLLHLPRLLPPPPGPSAVAMALGSLNMPPNASLHSPYRPYTAWGREPLAALLAASCPPQGRCALAVDQGLLVPYSEEAGRLELFLAGHDRVDLVDLRAEGAVARLPRVHALVHYACGERDVSWRQRFPRSLDRLFQLIQGQGMQPAWSRQLSGDCRVLWFVPDGVVLDPAALPQGGDDLSSLELPPMTAPQGPHPLDLGGPPQGPGGPPRGRGGQVLPRGSHRPDGARRAPPR